MKRVQLLLFALVATVAAWAAQPDFAFPQTVDKDARKDLSAAVKSHDAHAALNALMRVYAANAIIREQGYAQQSIELAEQTAAKFADSPLAGIFDALIATMYGYEYSSQSWIYNEREMPLEPRPADITEWSGEQYCFVIDSLLQRSIADPSALSALRISDYADIIEADKLTQIFYPTLLDFVCVHAASIVSDATPYYDAALASALKRGSMPAETLWRTKRVSGMPYEQRTQSYKAIYLSVKDSEYAALPLSEYIQSDYDLTKYDFTQNYRFADCVWAIEQIDSFLSRWPSAPLADKLKSQRQKLSEKKVSLSHRAECMSGSTLSIEICNKNTPSYTIEVFRLNNASTRSISAKDFKNKKPEQSIKMTCDKTEPFLSFDTISIKLDKQGDYAIIANLGDYEHSWVTPVRCVDVYPFSLSSEKGAWLAVVNPNSGAPIADAGITYSARRNGKQNKFTLSPTDASGISNASLLRSKLKGWNQGMVEVTYGGRTNKFDDIDITFPNKQTFEGNKGKLLTDRAIYHPGDSVHFLFIANNKEGLAKNTAIQFKLYDANSENIDETTITTDEWGRAYGAFATPTTGLTGRFRISCHDTGYLTSQYFTVSDYRMPEFELVDVKVKRDWPAKGDATVTGRAVYYSGMPMVGANITADLHECVWRWRPMPGGIISSLKGETDLTGEFSITFSSSDLASAKAYTVEISAVSPSGFAATASPVTFSLGKQYVIDLETPNSVDGEKPFTPECQLSSYSGDKAKFDIKWTISTLDSTVVLSGDALKNINVSSLTPARYRLSVEPVDTTLADGVSREFVLYNVSSGIVPETGKLIWMPSSDIISIPAGSQAEALFGLTDSAYVYVNFATDADSTLTGKWYAKGYHTLKLDAANGSIMIVSLKDFNRHCEKILTRIEPEKPVRIVGETFRDKLIPGNTETWRLRVVDGDGNGMPAAMALDMYNRALDAIESHEFSLQFYTPPIFNSHLIDYPYTRLTCQNIFSTHIKNINFEELQRPTFEIWMEKALNSKIYGYRSSGIRIRGTQMYATADKDESLLLDEVVVANASYASAKYEMVGSAAGVVTEAEYEVDEDDADYDEEEAVNVEDGGLANPDNIALRDAEVPLAVWAPQLTTDEQGNLCYTFTVPNANASWRLYATAWTQGLRVANLTRDFIANKPLMVQPNAPRFLRAGDKADVAIALLNNADSLASVQALVELFDPATGKVYDTQTFTCDIDSMAQSTIVAHVEASDLQAAIGLRVKGWTSRFGDGEQLVIPVLPSDASLIETTPFYLNPGDSTFTMTLPAQSDARISLTYCENPAWTIVSALPGLRENKGKYANSAAAAIFSAAISQGIIRDNPEIGSAISTWQANPSDSALVSMLEKNEDLKIALLNATPWVQDAQSDSERMARLALLFDKKQTSKAIDDAIDVLKQLQRPDGGWAWGDWCKESSTWVTGNVLAMMGELKSYGYLPADKRLDAMIKSALKYWDKEVEGPDMAYSIVRKQFADVPISAHGQQAITKTVNDVLKHWKSYSDPATKAVAARVLYLNGYPAKSRELMNSLTQFGVWSESQGLRFPSVNSLASYSLILKAYALIEPGSKQVDGIRQQLIVRKQATDWGSSVVTSEVVGAILSSGTRWTVEAQGADITAGGQCIEPVGTIGKAIGDLRANLSAHAGQTLTISAPATGPSYGAVYSQFSQSMADVKASACDDLSIEKTMMVRRGTEWTYVDGPLQVGDRVKVQLTIHSRRNLDYVAIIDERPAAFEPVDQLPGWLWSQSTAFYRENRDAYTAMHIVSLAPGTYQLTYEMNVNSAGTYSSGVATIQSQYAPELSAHSAGTSLTILP